MTNLVAGLLAAACATGATTAEGLRSLRVEEVWAKLDLAQPGLEAVRTAVEAGDEGGGWRALLEYYRAKHPRRAVMSSTRDYPEADRICERVFQWGPYEPAEYSQDMNWEWDPRGDIEWVAAMYRFYWAMPLLEAYADSGEEKYPRAFVDLTSDWIRKHPLEQHQRAHPVYTNWKGFAWLDIQTGIRAKNLCAAFPVFVHSDSFTPEFLGTVLASLFDHQVKTEQLPLTKAHNKAMFETRGFIDVACTFPEFADSPRWMRLGLDRACENLLAQTTTDGVQREWCGGYHLGVLRDAAEIMRRAQKFGIDAPEAYRDRIRAMYDYVFAIATPDLAFPMFGDTSRARVASPDRSKWPLYSPLLGATDLLEDAKYAARARLDLANLPEQTSYAFPEAGMYVMRDRWGPEQIYMPVHCSPPALSSHDQPDNGTFELYAYGRWLMPDSGYYTYGHDPDGRAWHRRTRVHQTLTLDGKDARVDGAPVLWKTAPDGDVVVVENGSYDGLRHRRTIWFVGKRFFVILDEAIGDASGTLMLHFQLAPGEAAFDGGNRRAYTLFEDANVLIWADADAPIAMVEEEGWYAHQYGRREPRKAFRYEVPHGAPGVFLSLVIPYQGATPPEATARWSRPFQAGDSRASLTVTTFGRTWEVARDISARDAWCVPQ